MIQKTLQFSVQLAGNGQSKSVPVDFSKDPVFLQPNLSQAFSLKDSPVTGVVSGSLKVTNGGVNTVTATVSSGVVTFTFTKAPEAGSVITVSGTATVSVLDTPAEKAE